MQWKCVENTPKHWSLTHSGGSPWLQLGEAAWPWAHCWSWWRCPGAGAPHCSGCWGPAPPDCTGTKAAAPSPAPGAPLPQTAFHYSGTVMERWCTWSYWRWTNTILFRPTWEQSHLLTFKTSCHFLISWLWGAWGWLFKNGYIFEHDFITLIKIK